MLPGLGPTAGPGVGWSLMSGWAQRQRAGAEPGAGGGVGRAYGGATGALGLPLAPWGGYGLAGWGWR